MNTRQTIETSGSVLTFQPIIPRWAIHILVRSLRYNIRDEPEDDVNPKSDQRIDDKWKPKYRHGGSDTTFRECRRPLRDELQECGITASASARHFIARSCVAT